PAPAARRSDTSQTLLFHIQGDWLTTPISPRYLGRSMVQLHRRINQEEWTKFSRISVCIVTCLLSTVFAFAQVDGQQPTSSSSTATVPRLIRIQGTVQDEAGRPITGNTEVTFSLYKDENDQAALWQESQKVSLDSTGHYNVLLGATSETGLPLEIFSRPKGIGWACARRGNWSNRGYCY